MSEPEMRQRLEVLSIIANGASVNGVALPEALERECRELHAALAQFDNPRPSGTSAPLAKQRRQP